MSIRRILLCVTLVCFLGALPLLAQDKPPSFLNLYEIHVKPGHNLQWESYAKKVTEAAEKVNAPQRWMIFQVAVGGKGGTYFVTLPFNKWADMDGWPTVPGMLDQAYGEEEATKLLAEGQAAAESVTLETYGLLEDYSTNYDPSRYAAKFYRVVRTKVKPEMNTAYLSLLERASNIAREKEGGPMTIRRANVMGTNFTYFASTAMNSWADADTEPDMLEGMSRVATQDFWETLNKCIVKREIMMLALRPDLSRMPSN